MRRVFSILLGLYLVAAATGVAQAKTAQGKEQMVSAPTVEAMELLINRLKKTKSNVEFLMTLQG